MGERYGLREVAPNKWRIWVYVDVVDGKSRQVSKQFPAVGLQKARRQATIEAAKLGARKTEILTAKGTVADLVGKWQAAHDGKDAASTVYRRRNIVKAIKEGSLGKIRLEDLTPMHIEAWYEKVRSESKDGKLLRTESTVHHWHRQLAAIINQGEKWDMIDRNPMRRVTPPARRRKRAPQPPTVARLGEMREQATPALALAIRLALATGLRRGELMGLKMSDIDGNMLTVERSVVDVPGHPPSFKQLKHDKPRRIHLDAGTLQAIRDYHALPENAGWHGDVMIIPDFEDDSGQGIRRPGWLTKAWGRLCVANGLHIRWHDIRHAHATTLHALGIPMAVISERIGHSLISTTSDIYTSAEATGDRLASEAIGRALDQTSTVSG